VPVSASRVISPTRILSAERLMTGAIAGLATYPIYAMDFDGENNYIKVDDSPSLRLDEFTIEVMRKDLIDWPRDKHEYVIFKTSDVWYGSISITDEPNNKATAFRIEAPQGVANSLWASDFWDMDWVHGFFMRKANEAWIYKGTELKAYKDTWNPDPIYYTSGSWRIPSYLHVPSQYVFIRIYDRILTEEERQHNVENLMSPITDGLVLWLDARKVVNDMWPDLSGNGNNGVIYGAEWMAVDKPSAETEIIVGWNAHVSGHEYVSTARPVARVIPCSR